nr:MAG TPA: KilA protein [Caudoviricetes sp.]
MKTNQEMIRPMGEFRVVQRTKDGFFNATELLKQWNVSNNSKKELKHYFENQSANELINTIVERENLNSRNSAYLGSRGKNGGTWMHPILFIDFAMWINPSFKYDVIKFVYDEMIKFRNLAGDAYPSMCRAVRSIMPESIFREKVKDLARSLNIIVYGRHESEMRNKVGDEAKIREMYELEKQIAQWVNIGLVGNYNQLKAALNKLYYQKYPNALPI